MLRTATDWCVPEWRDKGAYPKPDDLSEKRWRWEFVRRMPDYREAWDRAAPEEYQILCHVAEQSGRDKEKILLSSNLYFVIAIVPYDRPTEFHGLLKYQLYPLHNPRLAKPAVFDGGPSLLRFTDEDRGRVILFSKDNYRREQIRVHAGWTLAQFDLAAPLGIQLERAKRQLENEQRRFVAGEGREHLASRLEDRETRRTRRNMWPLYLRVIDARNEGLSFSAIGKAIKGTDDNDSRIDAQRWHRAAMDVANNPGA